MAKIYLSPERRPAPHGRFWGYDVYEHDYCCDIAGRLAVLLVLRGHAVKIADPALTIYQRAPEAKAWGADYYLPLHTNANTNGEAEGKAQGALVLCKDDTQSKIAAQAIFDRLKALRPSTRGIQTTTQYFEINNAPCVAAYPEIAFHDNGEDAKYLLERKQEIAQALCAGVCDYCGAEPIQDADAALGAAWRIILRAFKEM